MKAVKNFFIIGLLLTLSNCSKQQTSPVSTGFVCSASISITYTQNIKQILNQNCAIPNCHSGITSSGILLSDYANVKKSFQSGKAFCTIQHDSICKPMPYPPGSSKLPDSLIAILNCWAQKGFAE